MSPISGSDTVSVPEAARVPSSCTAPVAVPEITGVSFVPLTVTVTVWVSEAPAASVTFTVKISCTLSPGLRPCATSLSKA
nr:hypothetical protein [Hypericibacter adhaerens]